jgi:hypothetical protein
MGELTHDIVSLAELQFELFRIDCREGLKRMLVPVAMLLVAGIVAVGTVPIALIFIAEFLTQAAGLSRAATFSIATMSGFGVALVTWIKHALKRPAPIESQ